MPKCRLCGASRDRCFDYATLYGWTSWLGFFAVPDVTICDICGDCLFSYWDAMMSSANNLAFRQNTPYYPVDRDEVEGYYQWSSAYEDSWRRFMEIYLEAYCEKTVYERFNNFLMLDILDVRY